MVLFQTKGHAPGEKNKEKPSPEKEANRRRRGSNGKSNNEKNQQVDIWEINLLRNQITI